MADTNLEVKPDPKVKQGGYNPVGEEHKVWEKFRDRKRELLQSRKSVYGDNLDDCMRRWDRDYFKREADIPPSELDPDQKPIAINNAFGKVQAALSILVDRNPEIILDERLSRYSANRELIKSLAKASWKNTNSLGQLKLSIFNSAKRGWFAGRTFNKKLTMDARFPLRMDNKGQMQYTKTMITKIDDIAYMNLDNHNVWLDEESRPEDFYSIRDGMHREVWHIDKVRATFPEKEFPNMKYVMPGGNVQETIEGDMTKLDASVTQPRQLKKGMTELFFYENQYDDWFIIEIHGVMVVWEPLPQNHKRLSYTTGYWNLRGAETIYGIGVIEEMERDEKLIDRIMNMSMRQLLLSINPPGFYTGTEDLENENIKIKAGVFRKTLDPKNITYLQIPPMKKEAIEVIQWLETKEEQTTGITKLLEGEMGKNNDNTAFETGVFREASLKRLRLPLRSVQNAMNWEFMNRIDLIRQTYSDFQVNHLADEEEIMAYLEEVNADPRFFFIENEGQPGLEKFHAKNFREAKLNVEQNSKGEFIESEQPKFFKIMPEMLHWEGDVTVQIDSILVQSEELEKNETLRFTNILAPMFLQPMDIMLKPAKQLCIAFNKDPKKWLPKEWVAALEGKTEKKQPLNVPPEVQALIDRGKNQPEEGGSPADLNLKTIVPPTELNKKPSLIKRVVGAFKN